MVTLIKKLSDIFDYYQIGQHEKNYRDIEDELNNSKTDMSFHRREETNAHASGQIGHGNSNVQDEIDNLHGQVNSLVIGNNGDGIAEVTQARVDNVGDVHPTLHDRLKSDNDRFNLDKTDILKTVAETEKKLNDTEYRFEPKTDAFLYITDLGPLIDKVMQSFWIDNRTNLVYMTQAATDGYTITRMKANGQYMDVCTVPAGGHGTHNGYRYINGELWIYSQMQNTSGGYEVVRFKYVPNGTITYGMPGVEIVFTGHPEKPAIKPVINETENIILFRLPADEATEGGATTVEVRKLSDIDSGVNNILYRVNIPAGLASATQPMQGLDYSDGVLYWYTGDSNPSNPNYLTAFDAATNAQLYSRELIIGKEGENYPGGFAEAEGIQIYYDRTSGKKMLLAGVVVGGSSQRSHKIYGVGQRGMYEALTSVATPFSMSDGSGRIKPIPVSQADFTALSKVTEPGYYYLTTTMTQILSDFPIQAPWRDAGWFLEVTPSTTVGTLRQVLTRNSSSRDMMTFERIMMTGDSTSNWNYVPKTAGKTERIPSFVTDMKQLNIVGFKYYIASTDTETLKGFPESLRGAAGWICHVEPSTTDGFMQRLVKRNDSTPYMSLHRHYMSDGTTSPWSQLEATIIS